MKKVNNLPLELIEDQFWDYYSRLPNPMWYQHITETEDEEENTSDSDDTEVTTE